MKLRYLGLIPLLLVSGCGETLRYDNVSWDYNVDKLVFNVHLSTKDYVVKLENVYYVLVDNYPNTNDGSGHLAYNSFYIRNNSYKLVFYRPNK